MVNADRWGATALLAASLVLLAAWPVWRMTDSAPTDSYAQSPDQFILGAETYAATHQIGERDGMPVVQPPPGSDVPVIARRFQFWPALDLQAGETYRLHVAAVDTVHSVVVQGREYSLVPGQVRMVEVTGPLILQCGEYCGLGHNRMQQKAPSRQGEGLK
ncbi:MAG: quinol oxidase [Rhodospirillaceae bacterium]|nr:quinol oxidase [Rhodospirillales bacterium]